MNTLDLEYDMIKSTLPDVIQNDGESLREVINSVAQKTSILMQRVEQVVCDLLGVDIADIDNPKNYFLSEIDR